MERSVDHGNNPPQPAHAGQARPDFQHGELVLLANDAMRARHRPWAILLMWGWQAAWAVGIVWPLTRMVARTYRTHPDGDAVLFRPGALDLADFFVGLGRTGHGGAALGGHFAVLIPAGIVLGLLPLTALMASMTYATRDRRAPNLRQLWTQSITHFTPMAILLVIAGVAMAALGAGALGLGSAVAEMYAERWGDVRADRVGISVASAGLIFPCFVGILHDMARAAVVRFRVRALRAIALGWKALALHPIRDSWSYVWRAIVSWALVALGAMVAAQLGGRGGIALFALFAVHQLIIGSRVALRASWLAKALRSLDAAHRVVRERVSLPPPGPPAPATPRAEPEPTPDIPVHTDEPTVPILDQGA
ncbi:hypothetical protein [Pendulispora albinea]|uniref:Transmembrane protein n=1 Tax=Pendulispora albinea TaxID=2741071 RepID=A0ABZ2LJU4_9BACT